MNFFDFFTSVFGELYPLFIFNLVVAYKLFAEIGRSELPSWRLNGELIYVTSRRNIMLIIKVTSNIHKKLIRLKEKDEEKIKRSHSRVQALDFMILLI